MIESEVLTALTDGSPSLAAGRVYAILLPDETPLPAITYQRISTLSHNSLQEWARIDHVRMQVDCWASTYAEAKLLAEQVRFAMQAAGFKGVLANDRDDFEPDTETYRVSADYMVWQKG